MGGAQVQPRTATCHKHFGPLKGGWGGECCRKCTVRRVGAPYKVSGPDASGAYDASYCVVQGVGARRVGDVRRVVQCRTRCRTAPTPYDTVRHSTTQYGTVRHSTTQYDTVRHSTTQYDTVRHGTTQYDTVRHSTTQYDTVRHSTTRYDTVRHGTTQYDTVRHSTTQYDTVRHGTSHTDIYICRHINTCKWKKKQIGQNGAKWVQMRFHFGQNSPKGETSNIGTSRLQHADNVYN